MVAARDGIAYVECGGARVRIDHRDGWQTTYFHLTGVPNVHGKPVSRGQRIGSISTSTGNCGGSATGPHVHFTVWRNGSQVNLNGLDIGGWTVEDGAAQYSGCLRQVRDGQRVCQWGRVPNDGEIGSGADHERPNGSVDLIESKTPGTIRVAGWAVDPNDPAAVVSIHVYVGGPAGSGAPGHDIGPANASRPDVGSHAYDTTVPGPAGTYPVCVYAINIGPGANVELGCRTVGVANPNPYGSLDLAESATPGRIRIAGWAIDPNDPAASVNIHVYVGGPAGSGAPGHDIGPANGSRPDVGDHAYDTTVAGPAGTYPVCVYAINIGPGSNVELGCRTLTIAQPTPELAVADVSLPEGNSGTTSATFTVTLSAASEQTVTVSYATTDSSASAGSDYTTTTGSLSFAPGETTKSVTVAVDGDARYELDEAFALDLSEPANAVVVDGHGIATLTNDDPKPSLTISDVTKMEGNVVAKRFGFTVRLSTASGVPTTARFATTNGSAKAGSDYTAKRGTVTIAAGELTKTIIVNVAGDTLREANETFYVNLSNPVHAEISDARGVGTILNND